MDEWNKMSNEDKFNDAFGKLPIVVLVYVAEAALVASVTLFTLQLFGQIDWFLAPETMDAILSFFKVHKNNDKPGGVAEDGTFDVSGTAKGFSEAMKEL